MTRPDELTELRVSDADRNGTLRRLHNAVALGLIDITEFEERSSHVSYARTRNELDSLVGDLPGPGAIVTCAADRVELRGWAGSLKRHGEWTVPTRLALVRRMGSVELDLVKARFAGPVVVIELDIRFGSVEIRLAFSYLFGPPNLAMHAAMAVLDPAGSNCPASPQAVARPASSPRGSRYPGSMPVRSVLSAGVLSPTLPVPKPIPRPEYVGKPTAREGTEPWVQTREVIEKMRVAGRIAAGALAEAGKAVAPGVTTDTLDRIAHDYMVDHGSYPSTLGYRGFPKSCCTSLNEVICHGIPDSTVIEDGDIVNIDVTAYIDGVHGDTNATFLAGDVSEDHRLLVERTHEATMRAIKAVKPGRALSVVGRVIESYANRFGYNVVRDFTGHGIGTTFHNGLVVLHYDQPSVTTILEPGMTFTIEPMINLGALDYEIWDDGWTVVTKDRKWTAQFEHTLLVTESGAEILTLP